MEMLVYAVALTVIVVVFLMVRVANRRRERERRLVRVDIESMQREAIVTLAKADKAYRTFQSK